MARKYVRDKKGRFSSTGSSGKSAGKSGSKFSATQEDARMRARQSNEAFARSPEGRRRQEAFKAIKDWSKAQSAKSEGKAAKVKARATRQR